MRWQNFGMLSMRSMMYEVLDIPRMIRIKAGYVRNRKHIPKDQGMRRMKIPKWGGMILVDSKLSKEQFQLIPAGSDIKMCIQDPSVWEIFIPSEFKKSRKLLAKRLDAIAYM